MRWSDDPVPVTTDRNPAKSRMDFEKISNRDLAVECDPVVVEIDPTAPQLHRYPTAESADRTTGWIPSEGSSTTAAAVSDWLSRQTTEL